MEVVPSRHPVSPPKFEPDTDKIKHNLLQKGVYPTPKIVHSIRRKHLQKHNRKLNRLVDQPSPPGALKQELAEEDYARTVKNEFKEFSRAIKLNPTAANAPVVGRPWERLQIFGLKELASSSIEYNGDRLKKENLRELRDMFQARKLENVQWVFDDDIEFKEEWFNSEEGNRDVVKWQRGEGESIRFLVDRLSCREIGLKNWKFSRMMKLSGLPFTEGQLLKILDLLGSKICWKQAMSVVEWVYKRNSHKYCKSRFVYTKLLSVLGMARRPVEALQIFNLMRRDGQIYPDMAAYHSIAVTLGQAGLLKELLKVAECMRQRPSKTNKNTNRKNWDPALEPDVVVYNALLNACVSSSEWKGVYWVFKQLRKSGLRPNGATYGLAMEVMLKSGKYDHVHEFFNKMMKSGEAPKAITYKVIVRSFWKEGKVNDAVKAVRDMEGRGVVGSACVYYELACCLCNNGRWKDALMEIEKIKKLSLAKPLTMAFTGMILSSMDGGHFDACVSIFGYMKVHCILNIGAINAMLKVYGQNDMFCEAKELFEEAKRNAISDTCSDVEDDGVASFVPDEYTYGIMLEVAARTLHWEYFEHVYREMTLAGYLLDQRKCGMLVVESAIAGKGYLLEHAFEMILEAGGIPHASLFMEMIIQALLQHNYERAVSLISCLSYAPFQVSERQWTDLFETNSERIGGDKLENLLDALRHCDVVSEVTVSNLKQSLCLLCVDVGFDANERRDFPKNKVEMENNDVKFGSVLRINHDGGDSEEEEEEEEEDGHDSEDETEGRIPPFRYNDVYESKVPSAQEILEAWKDSRRKGIHSSFCRLTNSGGRSLWSKYKCFL